MNATPNHALQRTAVMSVSMSGVGLGPTGSVTGCAARHEAPAQPAPSPRAAVLTAPAPGPLSLSLGSLGVATRTVNRTLPTLCFACTIFCSGCAAVGTRIVGSYPRPYFSGVRGDAAMIGDRKSISPNSRCNPALAVIDMPFSLLADILFIPFD